MTMGIVLVACLARGSLAEHGGNKDIDLELHEFGYEGLGYGPRFPSM